MKENELFAAYGAAPGLGRDERRRMDDGPQDRFMARVERQVAGCWLYRGPTNRDGYGFFTLRGERVRAHVFAFEHLGGRTLMPGEVLERRCKGPRNCVAPDHWKPVAADQQREGALLLAQVQLGVQIGPREREFRERRKAAISTAIPHEEDVAGQVIHRVSTLSHARNGDLSTVGSASYGDEVCMENERGNEPRKTG